MVGFKLITKVCAVVALPMCASLSIGSGLVLRDKPHWFKSAVIGNWSACNTSLAFCGGLNSTPVSEFFDSAGADLRTFHLSYEHRDVTHQVWAYSNPDSWKPSIANHQDAVIVLFDFSDSKSFKIVSDEKGQEALCINRPFTDWLNGVRELRPRPRLYFVGLKEKTEDTELDKFLDIYLSKWAKLFKAFHITYFENDVQSAQNIDWFKVVHNDLSKNWMDL